MKPTPASLLAVAVAGLALDMPVSIGTIGHTLPYGHQRSHSPGKATRRAKEKAAKKARQTQRRKR